jgi:hypothetical protein
MFRIKIIVYSENKSKRNIWVKSRIIEHFAGNLYSYDCSFHFDFMNQQLISLFACKFTWQFEDHNSQIDSLGFKSKDLLQQFILKQEAQWNHAYERDISFFSLG